MNTFFRIVVVCTAFIVTMSTQLYVVGRTQTTNEYIMPYSTVIDGQEYYTFDEIEEIYPFHVCYDTKEQSIVFYVDLYGKVSLAYISDTFTPLIINRDEVIYVSKEYIDEKVVPVYNDYMNKSGTYGKNITWSLNADGLFTLSGNGSMDIDNFPWSEYRERIKSVEIKNGITSIRAGAFKDCPKLISVKFPGSITSISNGENRFSVSGAFSNCTSLNSINFPDGFTYIGDYAFFGCTSLVNIKLPDSITHIGSAAFMNCSGLENINIPDSVIDIGRAGFGAVFAGCTSLTNVEIPNSVTNLYNSTFANCSNLKNVILGSGIKEIDNNCFEGCAITNIIIPDSVTRINSDVFKDCYSLTMVTIPSSVHDINYQQWSSKDSFPGCTSLSKIVVDENNRYYTSVDNVLYDKSQTHLLKYPAAKSGKHYMIADNVTTIDQGAFEGCHLESLYIPSFIGNNLGYIFGASSYSENSDYIPDSLKKVIVGSGNTKIAANAFYGCDKIEEIELMSGINGIRGNAFYGCTSLKKITIPASVQTFGDTLFDGCDDVVIYCAENSAAHVYAIENSIDFVLIDGDSGSGDIPVSPLPKTDTILYIDNNNLIFDISSEKSLYGKVIIIAMYSDSGQLLNLINVPQIHSINSAYVVMQNQNAAENFKIYLWNSMSSIEPDGVCEEVNISDGIIL